MAGQHTRLPPLNALRAFWAVMRHGSFRGAAEELLVTPQAISQQIRLLEDTLCVPLFERRTRVIEPTEPAIVLSHFVTAGFDEFTEGIRRVTHTTGRNRININVSPYFATRYLMERLERFRQLMPGADIRMTTMVNVRDFTAEEVDVSIQWGFGDWRAYDVRLLVRDPKIVCCSPELARRISSPADLGGMTLLHPVMARDLWRKVLAHLGAPSLKMAGEIEFHDAATMRRGAMSGIGVGLVSRLDALADIEAGALVAPFGIDRLDGMDRKDIPGFYLVVPRAHKRVGIISAFCDWIAAEQWSETDT